MELITRFSDADDPNIESHRHLIPLSGGEEMIAKKLRYSLVPRVSPPPDIILGFGELDIILPKNIWVGLSARAHFLTV